MIRDTTQINGVLVTAGGRELSIDYVGGDCDWSASARADETSSGITVHVLIEVAGNGLCDAVGYARTANAVLDSPWNGRRIVDITGATVPTMDATQLLQPTWLPPGYVLQGIAQVGASDDNVDAGETWSIPSSVPSRNSACTPSQDPLSIREGVLGPQPPGYPTVPGRYSVNGQPATLQRANDPFDTGALFLSWTPPNHPSGWTVTVSASPQCQGDTPLATDTVLRFANGLR